MRLIPRVRVNINPIHKPRLRPRVSNILTFRLGPIAFIFGGRRKK